MLYYFTAALFYAIPVAAIGFFIFSLCRFLSARKQNKLQPGSIDQQVFTSRKTMMIVSSVILGILVAIVICMSVLIYLAVRFM